jgi:hypothetical protein
MGLQLYRVAAHCQSVQSWIERKIVYGMPTGGFDRVVDDIFEPDFELDPLETEKEIRPSKFGNGSSDSDSDSDIEFTWRRGLRSPIFGRVSSLIRSAT